MEKKVDLLSGLSSIGKTCNIAHIAHKMVKAEPKGLAHI